MMSNAPAVYGDAIADVYDELYDEHRLGDVAQPVSVLAALAGTGPALELGIGTGRIALPLARRGIAVQGIDASARMLEKLRAKPGGDAIPVVLGDFSLFQMGSRFSLIYVVFNTFLQLGSLEAQIECFETVARHLEPGGAFLVEAMVPDETLYELGQRVHVHDVGIDRVWLEAARYDALSKQLSAQRVLITEAGIQLFPTSLRFTSPTELDLMAQQAGMTLESRWNRWDQQPFTAQSAYHVSVYRAPAAAAATRDSTEGR